MKHQILRSDGTSAITYSEEDGRTYIGNHIDLDPHIKRFKYLQDAFATATKASNPNGWRLEARIPEPVLLEWLRKYGYNMHQWAVNEGGERDDGSDGFYMKDPGVKSRFMRYFKSRDFSKLHTAHVTSKKESSQIWMPK